MKTDHIVYFKKKITFKIKEKGLVYLLKKGFYILFCQVMGFLAYPFCWLLKIRFLPVYAYAIGHLCLEPDYYIKEGMVGLRPLYRTIVLAPLNNTSNQHLLNYWRKYLKIIDSPILCHLLAPLARNVFTRYPIFDYFFGTIPRFPEIQKRYGGRGPLLSLTIDDFERGWNCLVELGIPRDSWFVCVHCREDGYLGNVNQHMLRNVDIANYLLAMQCIIGRGGWIIRVGDPSMKTIPPMERLIDYAHLSIKSDWMDVFLCAKCRFFLGSNSGLNGLPSIFGVPSGNANLAPLSVVLPWGPQDVGIPKLLWSSKEKRYLSFKEILDSPISKYRLDTLYSQDGLQLIENTPEDIRDLAMEMLDKAAGVIVYSAEDEDLQARFKSMMNPSHYSFGAISRVGRDFLRKNRFLLDR